MLTASVTNDSATSALRSYSSAIARIEAAASFTALSEPTAPSRPTGVAAPTFVPGAIAATSHDNSTNDPADAARAPDGATKQTTGTWAFRIACVISRVDETRPPGVSISISTAACVGVGGLAAIPFTR